MIEIFRFGTRKGSRASKSYLESHSIACKIPSKNSYSICDSSNNFGVPLVLLDSQHLDRAKEILEIYCET